MDGLSSYDFIDCMLVDFVADKLLSSIKIITEAYYPIITGEERIKSLIEVTFNDIRQLNLVKNNEFEFDIQSPYDVQGNDTRANEVYTLLVMTDENSHRVKMSSDFLTFELICESYSIHNLYV